MRKSQISASMMCSNLVDLQATIDVFEKEPVISPELFELDNVVLSPHIGTGTIDGRLAMCECVSDNILHFAQQQFDKLDWVNKF